GLRTRPADGDRSPAECASRAGASGKSAHADARCAGAAGGGEGGREGTRHALKWLTAMPRAKQLQRARGDDEAVAPLDAAFKLVDALPVPVFFKSRDGRYLGVNRAWEEFFGVAGESFIGRQVADLYPDDPAIAEKHAAMDRALYARPGRQSYEITVRARDGKLRDTIYYKATYNDARGELAGLIGTIIDITPRKNAESALRESEERYRRTFELAGSGLAQVDLEGRFMRVNRR